MDNISDVYVAETAQRRWGVSPRKSGRQWNSPCPTCGGEDRFVIFRDGGYYCRQCKRTGWMDEDSKEYTPDPNWKAIHEAHMREVAEQRQAALTAWQSTFNIDLLYEWSKNQTDEQLKYWLSRGINERLVETYVLGFCPDKTIQADGEYMHLPAYTFPIVSPRTEELVNIQYRLVGMPNDKGKYRQEYGIPAANFYTSSQIDAPEVLIVEGAAKAIVVADKTKYNMPVVGLPGMSPHEDVIKELDTFGKKYLILDPQSSLDKLMKAVELFAQWLKNLYVVIMTAKPDDAFVKYGMTPVAFSNYLRYSTKIS